MLRITICVGSSCSVRGSDDMAALIEQFIERENLAGQVELVGGVLYGPMLQRRIPESGRAPVPRASTRGRRDFLLRRSNTPLAG